MNIYLTLYIMCVFVCFLGIFLSKQKIAYIFLSCCITFLTLIRFDTGWDYYWYWYVADNKFKNTFYSEYAYNNVEFIFKKIFDLARFFNFPPLFFIITGFSTSLFMFLSIRKYCKYPLLGISIYISGMYFYISSLGFVRQYLAVSIIFFLYKYLNKNKIKYIIGVILTSIFIHYSSIVGLTFLLLDRIKLKISLLILLQLHFMLSITKYLVDNFYPRYSAYFYIQNNNSIHFQYLIYCIIGVLIFIFKPVACIKKTEEKIFWFGISLYFILNYLFGGHLGQRISVYFIIFAIPYFSNSIDLFRQKKIFEMISILFFLILGGVLVVKHSYEEKKKPFFERRTLNFEFIFLKNENDFKQREVP